MLLQSDNGYRIELPNRPGAWAGLEPDSAYDAAGTLGYGHFCLRLATVRAECDRLIACGFTKRMER